jgi:hypothetical protein
MTPSIYRGGPIEAIVFKPVYPPRHDRDDLTYFGGYPTMSKVLAWPIGAASGLPLRFAGQLDLSKLPLVPQRDSLPAAGVMHFFERSEEDDGGLILYSEPDAELIETPPPNNRPRPLYTDDCTSSRPAFQRFDAWPKWWMEPVACPTYAPDDQKLNEAAFDDAFPLPISAEMLRRRPRTVGRQEREIWIPDATFPYLWMCIELWAGNFAAGRTSKLRFQNLDDKGATITEECHSWISRAKAQGHFRRTEASEVREFWDWLRLIDRRSASPLYDSISERGLRLASGLDKSTEKRFFLRRESAALAELKSLLSRVPQTKGPNNYRQLPEKAFQIANGELTAGEAAPYLAWLEDVPYFRRLISAINDTTASVLELSIELALAQDPVAAAAIPRGAIEYNRHLHWPRPSRRHQMFGHPQYSYGSHDDHAATHHLLMQFSSDPSMDWVWGDAGELYFWISDEDFRTRRFDRAMCIVECT